MITNINYTQPLKVVRNSIGITNTAMSGNKNRDTVSFGSSVYNVIQTKDKKEIKKLVNLFITSMTDSFERFGQSKPKSKISKLMRNITNKMLAMPYKFVAALKDSVTTVVKNDGKIVGGYSFSVNPLVKTAHINFLTISPELKSTKSSKRILLDMANDIYAKAKNKDIDSLTWTTGNENTGAMRLFSRLNAENTRTYMGQEKEFRVNLDDFKKYIDKFN